MGVCRLTSHSLQTSVAVINVVKESTNNFIELVKKEADQVLGTEQEKVENEIAELRDGYRKIKKTLNECEGKLSAQEKLTDTAQEETAMLRRKLKAS